MTNATTSVEAVSARKFFLPLMAASAAIALMTGFAGTAHAEAPKPQMSAEANMKAKPSSLIVKVDYRGDRAERRGNARDNRRGNDRNAHGNNRGSNRNARDNQRGNERNVQRNNQRSNNRTAHDNRRSNDRNRYDSRRSNNRSYSGNQRNEYRNYRAPQHYSHGNARYDRRDFDRDARKRYGSRGYYVPQYNWRAPARWRTVPGTIISVGLGRYANCFTVLQDSYWNGRPALVSVQYCDRGYGAPYLVRGSRSLFQFTYNGYYRW